MTDLKRGEDGSSGKIEEAQKRERVLVTMSKGTLGHYWWDYKPVQPLWRTVQTLLKIVKEKLPYNPAVPLTGIHPKAMKSVDISKRYQPPLFTAALSTTAKRWKQPRRPTTDEWIQERWYVIAYTLE